MPIKYLTVTNCNGSTENSIHNKFFDFHLVRKVHALLLGMELGMYIYTFMIIRIITSTLMYRVNQHLTHVGVIKRKKIKKCQR